MSLRGRLLVAVLALVSAALAVAAVAIYEAQRTYLYGHLDQRVVAAAAPISFALGVDARHLQQPASRLHLPTVHRPIRAESGSPLAVFLPSGTYGALIGKNGTVRRGPVGDYDAGDRPAPVFPNQVPVSAPGSSPRMFTVNSTRGPSFRYRVAALGLDNGAGAILVAVPSHDVDQTLDRLVVAEALVAFSVVVILLVLGQLVIRFALRPLDQMGRAASAIAGGELSHRVSPATNRTEIGRLGLALNRMLMRIEGAFADRKRSDERRRQFLSDASHELRTPLASIRGYAELFRMGAAQDPKALGRAMARIESEATRMSALVENLLVLARLDEMPEDRRVSVDLTEMCGQAVADAQAMAPDRAFSCLTEPDLEVLGDPGALRQVLANLLGNAVIHTPEPTPVELGGRREAGEILIEVRDHGPGLPPDAEDHVFERFWRAEGGRARGAGGSGLGLSIVKEIVQAHQGSVCARNHPDGGAVFTVRLPAASAPPAPGGSASPTEEPVGALTPG